MYSSTKIIRAIYLIGACALAVTAAQAVSPPPDGGYPNFNTAEGEDALFSLTTGSNNTAIGFNALLDNVSGANNTAVGFNALNMTTTENSTAVGAYALFNNYASGNTAIGAYALGDNGGGSSNTATGFVALGNNTEGIANTADGESALASNSTGFFNTATGVAALFYNLAGSSNTATGFHALYSNVSSNNTADGTSALYANTSGLNNTASGVDALQGNTTGSYNTAAGQGALSANTTGSNNTAVGQNALLKATTSKSNIAIGSNAGFNLTTGSSNIDIGNRGVAGESKTIRVGIQGTQTATFVAGISGVTVPAGVGVIVDTNGHLGTVVSSARYKDAIKPMDKASEAILSLEPVTFRYKHELDPKGTPQFGLVAEQVAKVDPDLVARDQEGKPYTVRYEAVNAMLLNEFLKEHRKVESLEKAIAEQQKDSAAMRAILKEQAAQIQKVSHKLEAQQPAPRVVADNQ
jgi:hypothetical protein